jgi:hypothetical protein
MVVITVTRPGIAVCGTPIVNVSCGVIIEAPMSIQVWHDDISESYHYHSRLQGDIKWLSICLFWA